MPLQMLPSDSSPLILIAEDDDTLRAQIARAIDDMGWPTLQLRNGHELLALLREAPSLTRMAMLITDLRMPQLDGTELLLELATTRSRLPTIVISAFADDETTRMVRALGASLVFSKPFDLDDLCTALAYLRQTARR